MRANAAFSSAACANSPRRTGDQSVGSHSLPWSLPVETEVKIRISSPAVVRKRLRELGFEIHAPRIFEANTLFDTADLRLRTRRELLRVRRAGKQARITFKGPGSSGPHKSREEIESSLDDAAAMESILNRTGFAPVFRYEKFRTEYTRPRQKGVVTLDQTPIGDYLEIEGSARWIDRTARELGYSSSDYITKSYGALYLDYCRENGLKPANMVFKQRPRPAKATAR